MIRYSLFSIQHLHRRFYFLLLALLPTQFGLHFWPEWAYVLGRRIDYLSPTIFVTDVIIFFLLLTWISDSPFRTKIQWRYIFPVIVLAVVNSWFAADRMVAMYAWTKVVEYICLGWYVAVTRPRISDTIRGAAIGVFYTSILAISQFIVQHSVGGIFWFLGERTFFPDTPGIALFNGFRLWLRSYGTFPHPNVLGGFLAIVLPLMLHQLLVTQQKLLTRRWKIFYITTFFLGSVALLLSFSRSAWVVMGIGISYIVYRQQKKYTSYIFGFLAICFLGLGIMFHPSFMDESVVRRVELNHAAISMWQRAPFVGVGLGNFLVVLPGSSVSRQTNFLQPVHNIYLLLLSEIGVVGILGIVYGIWGIGKKIFSRYTIYHIPCIMLLLLGFVDHYPLTLQQGQLLFTVCIAMTYSGR